MAQMNASLTDVETVFMPTSPEWSFLASSLVKEVARFGGDVSGLVPGFVHEALIDRFAAGRFVRLAGFWSGATGLTVTILGSSVVPGPGK